MSDTPGEPTEKIKSLVKNLQEISGSQVILCEHLENGTRNSPERTVEFGKRRLLLMCGYCSGQLFEKIVKEVGFSRHWK